ncbi:MAG: glycosyltransferase family 9 protein [Chloroherpetonaceae bacterium]|nr:glycosyltransferase family 9 protein [Chloroherpetonaceae bacterium]
MQSLIVTRFEKIYERLFEHRVLLFWESEMRSEILIHQEILRGIEPTYAPRAVEWRWNLVLPAEAQRLAIHWLSQNELWEALQNRPKPFSVLHMSALSAQDYKKLPLSKLAKVVEWLSAQGVSVVVVGTPTESSSLNELQALVNIPLRGCFHLDLLTVAALIRHAAIVLSSDSGIGHLAILVDTPTVRIFGPSFYWGFRKWKEGPFADIFPQIECAPCLRLGILNEKGLSALNCGHRNCLNQLSEHLVIEAVQSALSEKYSALSQKQNRI